MWNNHTYHHRRFRTTKKCVRLCEKVWLAFRLRAAMPPWLPLSLYLFTSIYLCFYHYFRCHSFVLLPDLIFRLTLRCQCTPVSWDGRQQTSVYDGIGYNKTILRNKWIVSPSRQTVLQERCHSYAFVYVCMSVWVFECVYQCWMQSLRFGTCCQRWAWEGKKKLRKYESYGIMVVRPKAGWLSSCVPTFTSIKSRSKFEGLWCIRMFWWGMCFVWMYVFLHVCVCVRRFACSTLDYKQNIPWIIVTWRCDLLSMLRKHSQTRAAKYRNHNAT